MTKKLRTVALAAVFGFLAFGADQALAEKPPVTFHFYGAKDCPPCMAFKRDGLPVVEAAAAQLGFQVAVNVIDRTWDVATPGSYGATDAILRRAGARMKRVYPPIFFVSHAGRVLSVHDADWRAALARAKAAAQRSARPAGGSSAS